MISEILSTTEQFLQNSWIHFTNLEGKIEDADKHIYQVRIQSDDSKLLIWVHGANLQAISHILSRILENILQERVILHIEVNDYLAQKDERLFRYVDNKIQWLIHSGWGKISFPQLTAYERRKVHNYLAEKNISWLVSHSEGEGNQRIMHVSYEKNQSESLEKLNEEGIGI